VGSQPGLGCAWLKLELYQAGVGSCHHYMEKSTKAAYVCSKRFPKDSSATTFFGVNLENTGFYCYLREVEKLVLFPATSISPQQAAGKGLPRTNAKVLDMRQGNSPPYCTCMYIATRTKQGNTPRPCQASLRSGDRMVGTPLKRLGQ
jgi:hypothetical protein